MSTLAQQPDRPVGVAFKMPYALWKELKAYCAEERIPARTAWLKGITKLMKDRK